MKAIALDRPPPGPGLNALTEAVLGRTMSLAEMEAVSCVLLTKDVGRTDPFHCTTEPGTKFEPFTVNVNAGPPSSALLGDRGEFKLGTGLPVCAHNLTRLNKANAIKRTTRSFTGYSRFYAFPNSHSPFRRITETVRFPRSVSRDR
jgi:hypothetical protein